MSCCYCRGKSVHDRQVGARSTVSRRNKKYVLWNMGICPIASKVGHVTLATPTLGSFIVFYVVLTMAYPTKKKNEESSFIRLNVMQSEVPKFKKSRSRDPGHAHFGVIPHPLCSTRRGWSNKENTQKCWSTPKLRPKIEIQDGGRPPSWICYVITSDRPHRLVKFYANPIYSFEDMTIWNFWRFGLKCLFTPPNFSFWG